MPTFIKRCLSKCLAVVVLAVICFAACSGLTAIWKPSRELQAQELEARHQLPPAAEVMEIPLHVSWENVDEAAIPANISVTALPDGIAFMATDVYIYADNGWEAKFAVPMGTKMVQFRNIELDGYDYRILGSLEDSYTIEYYPVGGVPDDGAILANQAPEVGEVQLPQAPTQTVQLKQDKPLVDTQPGESLSDEELQERYIEEQLRQEGYVVDRTPYYIGIGICVALIIIVITIRILLARR